MNCGISPSLTIILIKTVVTSVATISMTFACGSDVSAYNNWTRDVLEEATSPNASAGPLYVGVTTSIDNRLSALCTYFNPKATGVILRGNRDSEGNFWPVVSYEVATIGKTKWKAIGKSNLPEDRESVEVKGKMALHIDMEPFRASIENSRWGRIVLEHGETAVFALEDLLPPADHRGTGRDFKQMWDEGLQTQFGSSASLHHMTSIHDHLTGVFIHTRTQSPSELRGVRSADGDFWPVGTLFVGNSENAWQAIAVSTHEGEPSSVLLRNESPSVLRVDLDLFKAAIGRHKYGKIVFSDESFAIFLIEHLSPKAD